MVDNFGFKGLGSRLAVPRWRGYQFSERFSCSRQLGRVVASAMVIRSASEFHVEASHRENLMARVFHLSTRVLLAPRGIACSVLAALFLFPGGARAQTETVIPAGSDFWSTVYAGGQTYQDFSGQPIPADFFGPGSEPFTGRIDFMGGPIGESLLGNQTDTIVTRTEDAVLRGPGTEATVPIQITVLNLESVQPITVMIDGQETHWIVNVQAYPEGTPTPPGTITIRQTSEFGGTFDSMLPVVPMFTFFNASDLTQQVVLNGADNNINLQFHATGTPFLFDPGECTSVTIDQPLQLQFFPGVTVLPSSPNFHVGRTLAPGTTICKWVLTSEEAQLAAHGVLPARLAQGEDSDGDGIGDDCDNCPGASNPQQEDADGDCVGDACDNCVNDANYDQGDGDDDGHGDVCDNCPEAANDDQADADGDGLGDVCDDTVTPRDDIPPGDDCFHTECGGGTHFSFCDNGIPAGFFGDGSDPFTDSVEMGRGENGSDEPDTVARRNDGMNFGEELPSEATTQIELVQLHLVSCTPITVTFNGGQNPQQWNVEATLSETAPSAGSMTVTKTGDNGGTFDTQFAVQPLFTFTRVDDPSQILTLDTGAQRQPPFNLSASGVPWVHELSANSTITPCGSSFVPGVKEDEDSGSQCCVPVCHLANVPAHHCVVVALDCPCCPTGACCDATDGSCSVVQGFPEDNRCPQDVCEETGGVYLGDNTDCNDTDGDGLPDLIETGGSGDCCTFDPTNLCAVGTDQADPDSDGDGCNDGAEVSGGTNPCDPCDFLTSCGATPEGVDCCPDDPNKTDPGVCGCGRVDRRRCGFVTCPSMLLGLLGLVGLRFYGRGRRG